MPILENQTIGQKYDCTWMQFGTGDIHVNNCFEPKNAIYFAQHEPKPVDKWRIGEEFNYSGFRHGLESYDGKVVYCTFEKPESIDAIIEVLQETKRRMMAEVITQNDF